MIRADYIPFVRPLVQAKLRWLKKQIAIFRGEEQAVTPETAESAYVIVIRDHISSSCDVAMIREVIGPFVEMDDVVNEVERMLGSDARRLYHNSSDLFWSATQGLTIDDHYSLSVHETVLPVNSRWDGHCVPWTETERPPFWDGTSNPNL